MGITRWNPIREMAAMQSAMDRLFEQSWRPFLDETGLNMNTLALDVHEDEHSYTVTTELPGVSPERVNVRLDGEYLLIDADIPEHTVESDKSRALIKERRSGRFSRRLRLPQPINAEQVEASYENGVLKLSLPKTPEVQPRVIQVKTAGQLKNQNS